MVSVARGRCSAVSALLSYRLRWWRISACQARSCSSAFSSPPPTRPMSMASVVAQRWSPWRAWRPWHHVHHAGRRVRHAAAVGVDDVAALGVLVPPLWSSRSMFPVGACGPVAHDVFIGGACGTRCSLRTIPPAPCAGGDDHETTRLFAPLCWRRRARRCAARVRGRRGVGRASSGLGTSTAQFRFRERVRVSLSRMRGDLRRGT